MFSTTTSELGNYQKLHRYSKAVLFLQLLEQLKVCQKGLCDGMVNYLKMYRISTTRSNTFVVRASCSLENKLTHHIN